MYLTRVSSTNQHPEDVMKVHAKKIQVILGIALLTQVGCSNGQNQRGQTLYPNVATQQSAHSNVGDAFGAAQGANGNGSWGNFLNNAARVLAQPDQNQVLIDPVTGQPIDPNAQKGVIDPNAQKKDGTEDDAAAEEVKFVVEIDKESAWKAACKAAAGEDAIKRSALDTDGDGISDICEDSLVASKDGHWIGLDKAVYNGALVVAKKFYDEKNKLFGDDVVPMEKGFVADSAALQSIRLTKAENEAWKQAKALGGFGEGVDSKFDRQVTKKFFARSVIGGNDMAALRDLMTLEQIKIKDKMKDQYKPFFQASDQSKIAKTGIDNGLKNLAVFTNSQVTTGGQGAAGNLMKDQPQYALVKNNPAEMIPFPLTSDGFAVAFLSGIHRDAAQTLRQSKEFIYVAETHLVIPESVGDGMEIRVGNLVKDKKGDQPKALAGSRAGMFLVIHNNETDIVTTDLIKSKLTGDELKASMNTIPVPSNCTTVHLAIAFLADSQKVAEGVQKAIFNENVFYHQTKAIDGTSKDVWKPLPQEWMRLKAMSKNAQQKCEVSAEEIVLQEAREYLKLEELPLQ